MKGTNSLLFKSQIDPGGKKHKRLCVPSTARLKCLTHAHENFGHRGYKKVASDLSRLFYWPSIRKYVRKHSKRCVICQEYSKAKPKKVPMCEREVLTVPWERVCVDLVGPLPRSKGGVEYILTTIDIATRWPEAVALKSTTAQVVIRHLTEMFSRNGFPGVLVSDNGPQFISKAFAHFFQKNGIHHVRKSPYSPESNGVLERLHGTLKPMLAKCKAEGRSWSELLPMVLFILRMTPCNSSGFSPFLLFHGWEPNTPATLLYHAWVSEEPEKLWVVDWIRENAERVQALRDEASANYREVSADRKTKWDKRTSARSFEVRQQVWYRSPGLNETLQPSWSGPYDIKNVLGPLSYEIQVNRKKKSAHVKFLKLWHIGVVKRNTTTLEDDTAEDVLEYTNPSVSLEKVEQSDEWKAKLIDLCEKFGDILCEEPGLTNLVEMEIETGSSPPIYQSAHNTPVTVREQVSKEIGWLLDKGYIRKSDSPWSSPIVTVRKPNGSIRLCVDYKKANAVAGPAPFYMPTVEETLEAVAKARMISTIDLNNGYYQVKVCDRDIRKTAFAFVCKDGHYEFTRMPFGLKNAPAVFQKLTSRIMTPHKQFAIPYIDDVVIFSGSWEEHLVHVEKVLTTLREAGLTVSVNKCKWGGKIVQFLGHCVGDGKRSVPLRRVEAIREYRRPRTKKQMRAFLGVVSFYRSYTRMLADETSVLTPSTSKVAPNSVAWTEEMDRAFLNICGNISVCAELIIPVPEDELSVVTDAFGKGLGAVLQVRREGEWKAAAFYSRQTRVAEMRYSATELEALAVVEAVRHFSLCLCGREFQVFTDHQPLCSLMTSNHLNSRLKRMSAKLQPWLVSFVYLPGKENTFADALSRQDFWGGEEHCRRRIHED